MMPADRRFQWQLFRIGYSHCLDMKEWGRLKSQNNSLKIEYLETRLS